MTVPQLCRHSVTPNNYYYYFLLFYFNLFYQENNNVSVKFEITYET